jgi:hypothetical protein
MRRRPKYKTVLGAEFELARRQRGAGDKVPSDEQNEAEDRRGERDNQRKVERLSLRHRLLRR